MSSDDPYTTSSTNDTVVPFSFPHHYEFNWIPNIVKIARKPLINEKIRDENECPIEKKPTRWKTEIRSQQIRREKLKLMSFHSIRPFCRCDLLTSGSNITISITCFFHDTIAIIVISSTATTNVISRNSFWLFDLELFLKPIKRFGRKLVFIGLISVLCNFHIN